MLGNIYPRKQENTEEKPNNYNNQLTNSLDMDDYENEVDYSRFDGSSESQEANDGSYALAEAQKEQALAQQFDLGIQAHRVTYIQRLNNAIRNWERLVQVMPFWRNEVNTINITFAILVVVVAGGLIISQFVTLPDDVPIVYDQRIATWVLYDKVYLLVFLISLGVFEMVLIRLKRIIFNFDRRLSSVMAGTQLFFNILVIIGLIQLVSLMLI